jgi:LuxR family maltose regulon positive regulatory protein
VSLVTHSDPAAPTPPAVISPDAGRDSILLTTKLAVPPARPDIVARARLTEKLEQGLGRRLILLAAPAGFGKTTLLSSWVHQSGRPVAWVTLDSSDDEVDRFWTYAIAALDLVYPGACTPALTLLRAPQPPPIDTVLSTLINNLSTQTGPIVLVFDDFHAISSPAVHASVAFLIEHLSPQMHLAIATRSDPPLPLARYRTRGQLVEVRGADLRFTTDEAAEFLTQTVGLALSADDVAALEARTEGWIAGLQLAALSMQGRKDIAGFIQAFTGSHRYVVDYLIQEVLSRQSEPVQTFLLQTSILDRVNASLGEAVTGLDDAEAMLEQLDQANLFIVPLDDERHWYRYHQLFGELLRYRLQRRHAGKVRELHQRASDWFARHGYVRDAIRHALSATDYERAARFIENASPSLVKLGEMAMVRSWLNALPEEVVRGRARLALLQVWNYFLDGQFAAVNQLVAEIERRFADGSGDASLTPQSDQMAISPPLELSDVIGEVLAIRAFLALNTGDHGQAIALARLSLAQLSASSSVRGIAAWCLGLALWLDGDVTGASTAVAEAQELSQAAGHLYAAYLASADVGQFQVSRGQLRLAEETYRRALRSARGESGTTPAIGLIYVGLGELHREWNDLDRATTYLCEAIEHGEQLRYAGAILRGQINLARTRQAQGDGNGALALVEEARRTAETFGVADRTRSALAAIEARLHVSQGETARARAWAESSGLSARDEINHKREAEYLTLARVLLAEPDPEAASPLLARLLDLAESQGRNGSALEIRVLQALADHARGDAPRALDTIVETLEAAEPEGYVRLFVDEGEPMRALLDQARERITRGSTRVSPAYVHRLLAAFDPTVAPMPGALVPEVASPPRAPVELLPEPLSEREVDVLRLIAAGYSNREIADNLVLAVSTVKWYVNAIYGKLQVDSRTKAVNRARSLGLIGG